MSPEEAIYDLDASQTASGPLLADYAARSIVVRQRHPAHLDLKYGPSDEQTIDAFVPEADHPVPCLLYFHGGWWKTNNRATRAFLAEEYVRRGIAFVSIGYPLAPATPLPEICASAGQALAWLYRWAGEYGIDRTHMVLAGNSAGAHLATWLSSEQVLTSIGLPADAFAAVISLSGVYDFAPLVDTFVEQWLSLPRKTVAECSPIHRLPVKETPLHLFVGDGEPEGFKQQQKFYLHALQAAQRNVTADELRSITHFSIIGELGQTGSRPFDTAMHYLRKDGNRRAG